MIFFCCHSGIVQGGVCEGLFCRQYIPQGVLTVFNIIENIYTMMRVCIDLLKDTLSVLNLR